MKYIVPKILRFLWCVILSLGYIIGLIPFVLITRILYFVWTFKLLKYKFYLPSHNYSYEFPMDLFTSETYGYIGDNHYYSYLHFVWNIKPISRGY